jgi:hypothetical protein
MALYYFNFNFYYILSLKKRFSKQPLLLDNSIAYIFSFDNLKQNKFFLEIRKNG